MEVCIRRRNEERLRRMSRRHERAWFGRAGRDYPKGSHPSERLVQEGEVTIREEPPRYTASCLTSGNRLTLIDLAVFSTAARS
jgi:hypothetical protein